MCRVWGFLKYHHSKVSKGKLNWDDELVNIIPRVIKASSRQENEQILLTLCERAGKVKPGKILPNRSKATLLPDLKWIDACGTNLRQQLVEVKECGNRGSYYLSVYKLSPIPLFKKELPYNNMSYPTLEYRLLALFRVWNVIQYYYPYKHLLDEDWNLVSSNFIAGFNNAQNDVEYQQQLRLLSAQINDSHVNISFNQEIRKKWKSQNWMNRIYALPADLVFVNEKLIVKNIKPNAGEMLNLKRGDIILKKGNIEVDSLVKSNRKDTPTSNNETFFRDQVLYFRLAADSVINLTIQRNQEIITVKVACQSLRKSVQDQKQCRWISPELLYLHLNVFNKDSLKVLMPQIHQSKAIILDLRDYPNQRNNLALFINHLLPQPTTVVHFAFLDKQIPGRFAYDSVETKRLLNQDFVKVGTINPDYYKGRLILLIDENTQSAAETQAVVLNAVPGVMLVGGHTAGANGNVPKLPIPGGIAISFSSVGVYNPDGTCTQRTGILPDVEVRPSIEGIKQGKDEILEKAIEVAAWFEEKYLQAIAQPKR